MDYSNAIAYFLHYILLASAAAKARKRMFSVQFQARKLHSRSCHWFRSWVAVGFIKTGYK